MNECKSCSKEKATALSYPILGEENNLLSSNTGSPLFGKTSHPTAQSTVFHELPASPASGCQERWLKCRCLRPTHRPADLGPGKPASVTFQVILGSWRSQAAAVSAEHSYTFRPPKWRSCRQRGASRSLGYFGCLAVYARVHLKCLEKSTQRLRTPRASPGAGRAQSSVWFSAVLQAHVW